MGGWKGSWMTTFKQAIIDALEKKYEAQRSQAEANIKVYMENPVGVGEHIDIVQTVDKEMQKISKANEMLEELANWR
jgi:predicted sugar kinase